MSADINDQKVFRDVIKKHCGNYYVTYNPADSRSPIATASLTFPEVVVDVEVVKGAMEQELEYWLKQYPIPTMVTSFDAKDDVIRVSGDDNGSHLIGYFNTHTGRIIKHWELINNNVLPKEQMEPEYLARVYEGLPFRRQEDVRMAAFRKARTTGIAIRFIVFFVVGIPVLIEIVSLGVDWIGYLLSGISISVGLYKFVEEMGWIKPTKRAQLEAEKNNKMRHYYYHCEKNPEAFLRLKIENFEREMVERTLKEAEEIRKSSES